MLPDFLFTVGNSMQDARDDYNLLNAGETITTTTTAYNTCDKDMCSIVQQRVNVSSPSISKSPTIPRESPNNFDINTLSGIKTSDTNHSPVDLFPMQPTTWHQHPMNSHEHAHHRLQMQHPHQRLDTWSKKLLLLRSDDPMICRGANNEDEHQAEFKTLIAAVANNRHELPHAKPALTTHKLSLQSTEKKRPPLNGCSSLTKQQLKVKASLMSAQNQLQNNARNSVVPSTTAAPITAAVTVQPSATAPASKQRTTKSKKKGALKLRFHHQALPPEYLSHYEATQRQHNSSHAPTKDNACRKEKEPHASKLSHAIKLPPPKSAHENVRSWLQKIAELQRSAEQQQLLQKQQQQQKPSHQQTVITQPPPSVAPNDVNNNHQFVSMETKHTSNDFTVLPKQERATVLTIGKSEKQIAADATLITTEMKPLKVLLPTASSHLSSNAVQAGVKRVVNYSDLPYMGEMTLDNCKPRRGRKPKKTDICHLIYKNYGTIFPGTPKHALNTPNNANKLPALKAELQNVLNQPLNLSLRDQSSDLYSISSGEDDDDDNENLSSCPTPLAIQTDTATDQLLAANLKTSMPALETQKEIVKQLKLEPENVLNGERQSKCSLSPVSKTDATNALLHPVSVYYQKLLESGTLIQQSAEGSQKHAFGLPVETICKDNQLSLKIPIPSGIFITPKIEKSVPSTVQYNNNLDYPEPMSTPSSIKSENSTMTTGTTASSAATQQLPPQKRKRSAIFIPPIPAENTTNPATEVSICKFKFTGGAKPTLQEKKMLSVDSDGNYRYYSGTGAMRGYEFFPRESLQQSGILPGVNCAAVFPAAAGGEKISLDIPPPSAGLSNELLQIPDSPTAALLLPPPTNSSSTCTSPQTPLSPCSISPTASLQQQTNGIPCEYFNISKKSSSPIATQVFNKETLQSKKKSRRSSQREKLEKTFKEKGFLIQTQQLESAEGATYCKFRQLKKFTRYLFRNWKDYLPDVQSGEGNNCDVVENKPELHANTVEQQQQQQQTAIDSLLVRHGFNPNIGHQHSSASHSQNMLAAGDARESNAVLQQQIL